MTTLLLNEHERSEPVALGPEQRKRIRSWFAARFEPADDGKVVVVPGARIGSARIGDLDVVVRPKLPIARLLRLIAEVADPYRWLDLDTDALQADSAADALGALFTRSCLRTFDQGLYHAYRSERQSLPFVRGRMRIAEYAASPMPLPIPVTAGVFDTDNAENQVLRAALTLVRSSPVVSDATRSSAQRAWRSVEHVAVLRDPLEALDAFASPDGAGWNRRNQYYRQAIGLACLVLQASGGRLHEDPDDQDARDEDARGVESAATRDGAEPAHPHSIPGFVINTPEVVEQWVRMHLRAAWGLTATDMPDTWEGRLWLDEAESVKLKPDLGVRQQGSWRFLGDVKYKDLTKKGVRSEDLYQLVSYLAATGMRSGTLVYAGVGAQGSSLRMPVNGTDLHVVTVDLSRDDAAAELIRKVGPLAERLDAD